MSTGGIAGSYSSSICNFLKKSPFCFSEWLQLLHSHQHYIKVTISSHLCQYKLLFEGFSITAILTDMREYFVVVLILISLIIYYVDDLFTHLSLFCMSSLEKYLLKSFFFFCFFVFFFFFFFFFFFAVEL